MVQILGQRLTFTVSDRRVLAEGRAREQLAEFADLSDLLWYLETELAANPSLEIEERVEEIARLNRTTSTHDQIRACTDPGVLVLQAHRQVASVQARVIENRHTPEVALLRLANDADPRVAEYVARNGRGFRSVFELLCSHPSATVRARLGHRGDLPDDLVLKLLQDDTYTVRMAAVGVNPRSEEALRRGMEDAHQEVRSAVAANRAAPGWMLAKLASDEDRSVRAQVAANPNTPAEVVEKLTQDPEPLVATMTVGNPPKRLHLLPRLSVAARLRLAQQYSSPILAELAEDESAQVRMAVGQNRSAPERVLMKLAKDPDQAVRLSLLTINPSNKVLLAVAEASEPRSEGRKEALKKLRSRRADIPERLGGRRPQRDSTLSIGKRQVKLAKDEQGSLQVEGGFDRVTEEVAAALTGIRDPLLDVIPLLEQELRNNPELDIRERVHQLMVQKRKTGTVDQIRTTKDPVLLAILSRASDSGWRAAVADNENTPEAVLLQLAKDPEQRVRVRLCARNQRPSALEEALARDPDEEVRRTLACQEGVGEEAALKLAHDHSNRVVRALAERRRLHDSVCHVLANEGSWIRESVAVCPTLPLEVMEKLAQDPEWRVRFGLATNAELPEHLLQKLIRDPVAEVAAALLVYCSRETKNRVRLIPEGSIEARVLMARQARDAALEAALSKDPAVEVRLELTKRLMSEPVMAELARSCEVQVRRALLEHSLGKEALLVLATDSDPEIRRKARSRASGRGIKLPALPSRGAELA